MAKPTLVKKAEWLSRVRSRYMVDVTAFGDVTRQYLPSYMPVAPTAADIIDHFAQELAEKRPNDEQ